MDLSVVIVSHNHEQFLATCLESLKPAMQKLRMEVLVVDNASTDRSVEVVRQTMPQARLLVNSTRRGLATNNNRGITRSTGRYVAVLNPDTEVLDDALPRLVAFMDSHPRVGISGPQLLFPDGRIQPSCRRFPTWRSFLARRTLLRPILWNTSLNSYHLMMEVDHSHVQEVDWMLGACLVVRRKAIDEVGLQDEGYYLYVEDIDWCYRMHLRGWKVCYVPMAKVVHHHRAETDRRWLTPETLTHYRSMFRFVRKYRLFPRKARHATRERATLRT